MDSDYQNKNSICTFLSTPRDTRANFKQDGWNIHLVDQYKFLGIIFDSRLSFIFQIKYFPAKCNKAI